MIENYDIYRFSLKEKIRYTIEGLIVVMVLGGVFYKSIFGIIMLSPLICLYYKNKNKELIKKKMAVKS